LSSSIYENIKKKKKKKKLQPQYQYRGAAAAGRVHAPGQSGGLGLGLLLLVILVPLLFMLENSFVAKHDAIQQGLSQTISVPARTADPQLNGRLVHVSGKVENFGGSGPLSDPQLGVVAAGAVKLRRESQMFQFVRRTVTHRKTEVSGGVSDVTEEVVEPQWSASLQGADVQPQPHTALYNLYGGARNPASWFGFEPMTWSSQGLHLGQFALSEGLVRGIDTWERLPLVPANVPHGFRADSLGGEIMSGDPLHPRIGDMRIRWVVCREGTFSVIARQAAVAPAPSQGGSSGMALLAPYQTSNGQTIELIVPGAVDAQEMFRRESASNYFFTNLFRFLILLGFFLAFSFIFSPLTDLLGSVPIIGSIARLGVNVFASVLAVASFLVVFAGAWIAARPWYGLSVLVVAMAILFTAERSSVRNHNARSL
jgi:hypothetical protein